MKMGYCANSKRRYIRSYRNAVTALTAVTVTLLTIIDRTNYIECASLLSRSSPGMKSFDIWSIPSRKTDQPSTDRSGTITMSNDILLHDYREKTSLRSGKVLNFFPVLNEDECKTEDGRRSGICMNVYDCHSKGGQSRGHCSLGFGACCVFTASCTQEVKNNITYIVSPSFPGLTPSSVKSCALRIKMVSPDISQLRFDFVHFSMGQPNRRTGNCDGDLFSLFGGSSGEFKLCGQNNGQHIYYDVTNGRARDGEATGVVDVVMNLTSSLAASRFWEIRVSQIPFSQRAPAGCLQYFMGNEGLIQTFNFAENGRHLANQNYRACIRQERGMCSIMYEPCNDQSFRIGQPQMPYVPQQQAPNNLYNMPNSPYQPGSYPPNGGYPHNAMIGPDGMIVSPNAGQMIGAPNGGMLSNLNPAVTNGGAGSGGAGAQQAVSSQGIQADEVPTNGTTIFVMMNSTMPTTINETTTVAPQNDDVEGSGDGEDEEDGAFDVEPSFFSLGSFLTRAVLFRSFQSGRAQPQSSSHRSARQFFPPFCTDRITLPCIVEDFISTGMGQVPSCTPVHCGGSLCPPGVSPCRIETTVTPFGIGFHFGDGQFKGNPEENIGACLRFKQVNCI